MKAKITAALILISFVTITHAQPSEMINYIPLGDSYTIGTGTSEENSFPALLTSHLIKEGVPVRLVANPAINGFTTLDLIAHELPSFLKSEVNFTTILIGVNDWVQGIDEKTFAGNIAFILDRVQGHIRNKNNILLITVPDFSITPEGEKYLRGRNAEAGLTRFNDIIKQEAKKRKLAVVDIFVLSKTMVTDTSLVADDNLHPSAKGYALWEKMIFDTAIKLLRK